MPNPMTVIDAPPAEDHEEYDWPEISQGVRELSLAIVNRAFDWLDQSVAHDTDDSVMMILVLLDLEEHDIAYALMTLMHAYNRAAAAQ